MLFKLHLHKSITDLLQNSWGSDIRQHSAGVRWTHIILQMDSFDFEASAQLYVDLL